MITNYSNSSSTVLMDADFLIALYIDTDSNHQKALDLYSRFDNFSVLNLRTCPKSLA